MKRRVLSLTMAFLLAFTMLPTQAAAEEVPEYEEVVEEEALETKSLDTESLEAEEPAAETENTEGTVLTEETEEMVTEAEPAEEVTDALTAEETEEPEVKEEVPAEEEEVSEAPAEEETKPADAEEIQSEEQNASVQAMEANGVAVQAEDGETECMHPNATETECPDCGITWCIKDDKETKYTTLKDAFENASSGSTLTLLKAVNDGNITYTLNDGKTFTLDTQTYAVSVSKIQVNGGGTLILKGSGEISAVWTVNSGKLDLPAGWTGTIEDVTLQNGTPGLNMESGIVKELYLSTNGSNNNVQISGGTFNSIKNPLSNPILLNKLLKKGYVFKQGNQAIEFSRELSANESLRNVRVEKCEEHRDKNNDNKCDFCNQEFTVRVQTTDKDGNIANYSGLQGAFNEAQNGATVKLLTDIPAGVDSAYIVDKKQLTLDLNGQTISGSGISVTNNANLTITGMGTVEETVTFDATSQGTLKSGRFGSVVSNNPDKTLQNLLPEGYAYRHYGDSNAWETDITGSLINNVEVLLVPIQRLEITNNVGDPTYGNVSSQDIHVTPVLTGEYNATMVTYRWYKVAEDGAEQQVSGATSARFNISTDLSAGKHTYRVYATCDSYTAKADVTFEVKKADAKVTEAPIPSDFTYTGRGMYLIAIPGLADGGTLVYSFEKDGEYKESIPSGEAVGEYTIWYKVKGDSNHNDTEPVSVTARISYLTTSLEATLADTNKGENGWYTGTVTIQAPYYTTISPSLKGPYTESFTTDQNGENIYYLRMNVGNQTTDAKTIQVPIDTQAPTKPTLTIREAATDTTVTLRAAATDATSGVQEYILKETANQVPEQKRSDGVFSLTGLTSDTQYTFTVTAKDNAGNVSEVSDVFNVKTRKIPFANAVVTLKNTDKIYNGTAQMPDVEVSMNGTVLAADQYVVSYEQNGTAVAAPTKAGMYKVVVTASENGDYEGTASDQPGYTIAKKTITVSLNGTLTKTYDGTTKVLEAQKMEVLLNGVEDGDEVIATADAYVYNSADVKAADTITGSSIALAGADAENYQLAETKASVSAKILPKDLAKAEITLGAALVANGKTQTQAVENVMVDDRALTIQDYEVIGNQAAAAGSYTLTIAGKNNYTGKVQKTYVVVPTEEQMAADGNGDVKIGEGTVKVSVSAGQDAPEISLVSDKKTLIKMLIQGGNLTADEIVLIAEGATIELALNVEHAEATVSAETRSAMEKTAGEFTIGRYLNITFTKSVNGEDESEIHEINAPIKISFRLSADLLNTDNKVKREYMVLRNHDGEVTTLPGTFADGIITFETDRFSDYAIAWKDTAVSTSGSKKKHRSGSAQQEETVAAAAEVSQLVQAQSAPTGDQSPLEWMLLLAALSAAGIGMTLARKRKG